MILIYSHVICTCSIGQNVYDMVDVGYTANYVQPRGRT